MIVMKKSVKLFRLNVINNLSNISRIMSQVKYNSSKSVKSYIMDYYQANNS